MRSLVLSIAVLASLSAAACASETGNPVGSDSEVRSNPFPGTYYAARSNFSAGDIYSLSVIQGESREDLIGELVVAPDSCGDAGCSKSDVTDSVGDSHQVGPVELQRSERKFEIKVFKGGKSEGRATFEYRTSDGKLSLRAPGDGEWTNMRSGVADD